MWLPSGLLQSSRTSPNSEPAPEPSAISLSTLREAQSLHDAYATDWRSLSQGSSRFLLPAIVASTRTACLSRGRPCSESFGFVDLVLLPTNGSYSGTSRDARKAGRDWQRLCSSPDTAISLTECSQDVTNRRDSADNRHPKCYSRINATGRSTQRGVVVPGRQAGPAAKPVACSGNTQYNCPR